jgi:hypothetical protein
MKRVSGIATAAVGLLALLQVAGCPTLPGTDVIVGGAGGLVARGTTASVTVFSPAADVALTGGTPVEVNWRAVATTNFASVDIYFDVDTDPTNGNEIIAERGLPLTQNSALLDTTRLDANTYFIAVVLSERNQFSVAGYAPGRLILNQASRLTFLSPRGNFTFDRSNRIVASFDVAWEVNDPDSTVSVSIFLDPDATPNGNEILLRESSSQTGDSFRFDLPTHTFAPGTYRILAVVSDGVEEFTFYAPGSITLRTRFAGYQDLRTLGLPDSDLQGAVFEGFNPGDNLGSFVTSVRDVDGDGFSDFLIVAQFGKPNYQFNRSRTGVGEAYLVYGRANRFAGDISVNSVGRLLRGEIYTGPAEVFDPIRPSRGITSFAVLSDWDQDGVNEFAFGLPFTDSEKALAGSLDITGYFRTGAVVVAAGSSLRPDFGFPGGQVLRLEFFGTLPHLPIQTPVPCPEGYFGPKAAAAFGGDGVSLYHRHRFDVTDPPPNTGGQRMGCRFSTNDPFDQFGETISAYDFEGILMSAPNRDPYVATVGEFINVPGSGVITGYFNSTFAPFHPWNPATGPPANQNFNYRGAIAPLGVELLPHGGPYHYVMDEYRYMKPPFNQGLLDPRNMPGYRVDPEDGEPCVLAFHDALSPGSDTFRFYSLIPGGRLSNVKNIGDFNGDGLQDILVGHPFVNDGSGGCFVVFGRLENLMARGELLIDELGLPVERQERGNPNQRIFDGLRILGQPGERLGTSQDGAGDFNGDGLPDLVIGSSLANNRAGGATVVFGSRELLNLTQSDIVISDFPARGGGVTFVGESEGDLAGARVVGVGDIDGDGLADIMIAAPNKSVRLDTNQDGIIDIDRGNCGAVYLVYGSQELRGTISLADIGTEKLPGAMFIGRASGDFLGAGVGIHGDLSLGIASAGDVDGDGRRDLLLGAIRAAPRNRSDAGEVYLIYGLGASQ